MASWWNKWKKNEEDEQSIRDKLATLGTPCVIEKNKVDSSTRNLASAINNLEILYVKKLINNGENINKKDSDGNTPLINVVILQNVSDKFKQHEIIEFLLKKGADVYIKNNYNYNILEIMSYKSHYDEIKKIFEKYKYFKNNKNENDIYLISLKHDEDNQEYKMNNPNEYKDGVTLLYYAIVEQDIEKVKELLNSNVDINKKNKDDIPHEHNLLVWYKDSGKLPIDKAIEIANIEIVELLIEYDSNINIDNLLYLSIASEHIELTKKLLVERGANPNNITTNESGYNRQAPLKLACSKQNFKMVKILVENGADVNLKGYEGRTALFNAIEATKANKDIIKYLIQNGADIYQEDDKGITPLSFAESSKKSMAKVLLESIPIELKIEKNFNSDDKSISNDNKFNEQNKVINRLQKEIKNMVPSSKIDELSLIIETQSQNIQNLEKYLQLQLDEINNIKKEFINNQTNQTQYINELVQKIEKLEKENQKNRNIKKQKISLNIPIQVENKTINQNDGVLVKRENFDDF